MARLNKAKGLDRWRQCDSSVAARVQKKAARAAAKLHAWMQPRSLSEGDEAFGCWADHWNLIGQLPLTVADRGVCDHASPCVPYQVTSKDDSARAGSVQDPIGRLGSEGGEKEEHVQEERLLDVEADEAGE